MSKRLPVLVLCLSLLSPACLAASGAPVPPPPLAADASVRPPAPSAPEDKASLAKRMDLAARMADLNPPRPMAEQAISALARNAPLADRQEIRSKMLSAFDFDALRRTMVETMAATFTEAELQKMVEYNESPEARSIASKMPAYEDKLQTAMTRMLDVAMMVARTGKAPGAPEGQEASPDKPR